MPLIKLKEGLLERDNFYLTSSFSDFLGSGIFAKGTNYFELKSGEIKRNFPYQEFVIDVIKEPKELVNNEKHMFFIEVMDCETKELSKIGLCEDAGINDAPYWRITCHDRFIQTYSSSDGVSWENKGGQNIINQQIMFQGFEVIGSTSLVLKEYKVYASPFVQVQNFEEGFKAELYDKSDALIKTRLFNSDMTADIFLDNSIEGYFKIYDHAGTLIFTSITSSFSMGETYIYTPYELEMIYKGKIIDYGPTYLNKNLQLLELKNLSSEVYSNLRIIPSNATNPADSIELSLDGITYSNSLIISNLEPQKAQDLYIRITKANQYDFVVNEFELKIN